MRAAHGAVIPTAGKCPHKPLPNADWDGGFFWVGLFWAQTEVVRWRKRLGLRFIFSVGCVFTILGSSLTVVPNDASRLGTYTGFHGSVPSGMPIGIGTSAPRVTRTPISAQAELPPPRGVIPAHQLQRCIQNYDVFERTVTNLEHAVKTKEE